MSQPSQKLVLPDLSLLQAGLLPADQLALLQMHMNLLLPPLPLGSQLPFPLLPLPNMLVPTPTTQASVAVSTPAAMPLPTPPQPAVAASPERRRKRSRRSPPPPQKEEKKQEMSVLRMLCMDDDEPKKEERVPAVPSSPLASLLLPSGAEQKEDDDEDEKIDVEKMDEPVYKLRRLIRDDELPETVGPDSPLRHHPKYQKKKSTAALADFEALTAFCVVHGVVPDGSPSPDSGYSAASSPRRPADLDAFFSDIIKRELVTCE